MEHMFELPREGYVRLKQVLAVIPVSKSTWYRGIESGIYPNPVKLGKRSVGWDVVEIRRCMKGFNSINLEPVVRNKISSDSRHDLGKIVGF